MSQQRGNKQDTPHGSYVISKKIEKFLMVMTLKALLNIEIKLQ